MAAEPPVEGSVPEQPSPPPAVGGTESFPPGPPAKRARGCRIVLALGAILVLLVVLLEVALRLFAEPPPLPSERPHPFYRRVYEPGARVERKDPRTGASVPIETNAVGARGRSVTSLEKPRDAYRIVFLGGGPLEGAGLKEEVTAPARVEAMLNTRRRIDDDLRVEAINMAGEGLGLAEALTQLALRVPSLSPDLVLVLPGPEDLVRAGRPGWDPTRAKERHARPLFEPVDWLERKVRVTRFLRPIARALDPPPSTDRREKRRTAPFTQGVDLARATLPHLSRHLRLMGVLARDERLELAFATIPTLLGGGTLAPEEDERCRVGYVDDAWNLDARTLSQGFHAWNDEIRAAAAREGARLADVAGSVPRNLLHFEDEALLTAEGHAALAEALTSALFGHGPARRRR